MCDSCSHDFMLISIPCIKLGIYGSIDLVSYRSPPHWLARSRPVPSPEEIYTDNQWDQQTEVLKVFL